MNVRALTAADREAIAGVIASDETFKSDEVAVALELVDLAIAGSSDYEVRVATDDEGVCGYICFGRTPMTERTYDLYWIVVHARARGKGVARLLVGAMEAEVRARGGGQIRVETSETDGYGTARAVYARLGYPEASRLPDFYSPGDALITYYKVL
ncbi:MAG TPA: GNAT family N-acetyltransferase [Kofleriaceae bacterium]|nr:GNAT family N-acetyltransferase [Kofleriaceae bacterium]